MREIFKFFELMKKKKKKNIVFKIFNFKNLKTDHGSSKIRFLFVFVFIPEKGQIREYIEP